MSNQISGDSSTQALKYALDGLALRQQTTSRNIANVDTPGYKASTVSFEQQLQRSLDQGDQMLEMTATRPGHLAAPAPDMTPARVTQRNNLAMRQDGNNVDIEREMADLAETTLRYAAVSQLMSKKLALLRLVVSDGQR